MAPDCHRDRFTFEMAGLIVNIFPRLWIYTKNTRVHRLTIFHNRETNRRKVSEEGNKKTD